MRLRSRVGYGNIYIFISPRVPDMEGFYAIRSRKHLRVDSCWECAGLTELERSTAVVATLPREVEIGEEIVKDFV